MLVTSLYPIIKQNYPSKSMPSALLLEQLCNNKIQINGYRSFSSQRNCQEPLIGTALSDEYYWQCAVPSNTSNISWEVGLFTYPHTINLESDQSVSSANIQQIFDISSLLQNFLADTLSRNIYIQLT